MPRVPDYAQAHFSASTSLLEAPIRPFETPLPRSDLGFLMHRVAPAARTELFDRELLRLALLVLARGVITPLATVACQSD